MSDKIKRVTPREIAEMVINEEAYQSTLFVTSEDHDAEIARLRADRRERIATACLAGMLANSSYDGSSGTFHGCAYDSVMFADALIEKLDKEAKP